MWLTIWRALNPFEFIFWLPYFSFLFCSYYLFSKIENFIDVKAKKWQFGYSFKIALKAIVSLIFLNQEVFNMKGVRFDQPHFYVCKCDQELPEEEQTKFKVRFLTAKEQAKIRDMMYTVSGIGNARSERFLTGTAVMKALEYGLLGWENFKYEDGTDIEFNKENFSCIPPRERDEIANYIRGESEFA